MNDLTVAGATAARRRAEEDLERARAMEIASKLSALAKRILQRGDLLRRHHLIVAAHEDRKYPAIYLVKRDHRAWCHIWWCFDSFRFEAGERSATGPSAVMDRDLSGDVDMAAECVIGMLERDEVGFGSHYLPGDLRALSLPAGGTAPGQLTDQRAKQKAVPAMALVRMPVRRQLERLR